MKILLNKDNVVIAKDLNIEELGDQNFKCDDTIYPKHLNLHLVDLELDPDIQKHKVVNGALELNPNYVEPVDKDQIIADMTALLIEGGLL